MLLAATPTWGFAPAFRPAHHQGRGSLQLNIAGMELGDLITPAMLVAAALVVTMNPEVIPVEKIQKTETEAENKVEETKEKVEEAVKEVEAKVEEVAKKVEKKVKEVKQVVQEVKKEVVKEVKEETTPAMKVVAVKEPVVVVEEKVEVVAVKEPVVVPEVPKPVASTATPKTISQVKKEVASTLEGEREKQERIRLAAAKRELEKKEAVAETEGDTATVVAGEDINGSSEEQEKRSKSLRRKLVRVLKKSLAPWRKWENIK